MARVLWPNQHAIGQCMRVGSDTVPCTNVLGIAEDIVQRDLTDDTRYHYYLLLDQFSPASGGRMLLKMRGDPAIQGDAVRRALQPLMPGQGYIVVRPMREVLDLQHRSWHVGAVFILLSRNSWTFWLPFTGPYPFSSWARSTTDWKMSNHAKKGRSAGDAGRPFDVPRITA
jgi:hypothetical protein